MDAGELDVGGVQHYPLALRPPADDRGTPEEHAVRHLLPAGEPPHPARGLFSAADRGLVVGIKDGNIPDCLVCKDIFLGSDILSVALVDVQVVGRQVGHNGDAGAPVHGHQLEGAELQHRQIRWRDVRRVAQQRAADVAPQVDGAPGGLQELCDDRGGRGLAVGPGDGDLGTGADLKKDLHLGSQQAAPRHRRRQLRHVGPQAGGPEDHVLRQALQVVLPQLQAAAVLLQLVPQGPQGLPGFFVAGGDGNAPLQQQPDQGPVADADADDGHGLVPQRVQIFLKLHGYAPNAALGGRD